MEKQELKEMMVAREVAEYLNVSVNTINVWRSKNRGPKFYNQGYKRYVYKRDDVLAFAKEMNYVSAE